MGLGRILGLRARSSFVPGADTSKATRKLVSLCSDLLSERGGMSGGNLATDAMRIYKSLDKQGRIGFFKLLISDFSPSPDDVGRAADAYRQEPSTENLRQLQRVVEPPRQELFRRLNMATGGTRALIEMRSDILNELDGHPDLEPIAADLGHLLASWFNSGFLTLERIDWQSSAVVLEKLIEYEAVHLIQGWTDLRRRLEADRRCYAFFHSALPTEPLIFIEVALTRGMSGSIHPLLDPNAPVSDPESADSAIFYSITNCQKGLRGVPLGSSLIKQVVEDLRKSLPHLKTYATLSPIPGFRKWLGQELSNPESFVNDAETREIQAILEQSEPAEDGKWPAHLRQRLTALCAFYLLHEKRDSKPLDPVARFHLKNGARLERINPMADTSASAIKQSAGMMANYVYELGDLQRNHDLYVRSGTVSSSGRIERLARQILKR